jgi:hypothetical protein
LQEPLSSTFTLGCGFGDLNTAQSSLAAPFSFSFIPHSVAHTHAIPPFDKHSRRIGQWQEQGRRKVLLTLGARRKHCALFLSASSCPKSEASRLVSHYDNPWFSNGNAFILTSTNW